MLFRSSSFVLRRIAAPHFLDFNAGPQLSSRLAAFGKQKVYDPLSCVFAELLPELLLVKRHSMPLHDLKKVGRKKSGESTLGEVLVGGKVVSWRRAGIREVAAPAPRDEDLLPESIGMVERENPAAPGSSPGRAEKTGAAGSEHDHIPVSLHELGFTTSRGR